MSEVRSWLEEGHGVAVSRTTLQGALRAWGVRKNGSKDDDEGLRDRIRSLFYEGVYSDQEMLKRLRSEGFELQQRRLQSMRLDMGLRKRDSAANEEESNENAVQLVREVLEGGNCGSYGIGLLHTAIRRQGHVLSRNRIYSALKQIDPEGLAERRVGLDRRRRDYIVEGPNAVWSIDGYCKLEAFGIEIYACVDVYSRFLLWAYVGISGRTAVSVATQYLDQVEYCGFVPVMMRSDCGLELPMAAELHYELRQGGSDGQIAFGDAWRFGKSTSNIRIESWWQQLSRAQLMPWRIYFKSLDKDGLFNGEQIEDRIAFKAVYMPIIRQEVKQFVELWNTHRIRSQRRRIHSVKGIPDALYHVPDSTGASDRKIPVELSVVQNLRRTNLLDRWDPEEYLPERTLSWCFDALRSRGINLEDCDAKTNHHTGEPLHSIAYLELRGMLMELFDQGNPILLTESEKPLGGRDWIPSQVLQMNLDHTAHTISLYDGGELTV